MDLPFKKVQFKMNHERAVLLVSIGVSLLIWVFLKLSKTYETEKKVAIEYILPTMMEFTDPPPSSLTAVLSGTGIDLVRSFFFQRNPTISLDLALLSDPAVQRSELLSKIQEETGLDAIDINRNFLSFSLDSTATKKVPVILKATFVFQKDFFQDQPIYPSPDSVVLAGPLHELQLVDSVFTEAVTIGKIDGDISKTIPISMDGFKNITSHPAVVTLDISAEQYTEKIMDVPIVVRNAPFGTQLNPSTIQLTCTVGLSKFHELSPDSFLVEVDLAEAVQMENQKKIPVYLKHSPEWVKAPSFSPKVVEYLLID